MSILYACVVSRLHVPHARPSGRQPPGAQVMLQIPGALSGSLGRCISRDLAGQWRLAAPTMTNNGPSPRRPPLCSSVSKGWRDVPAVGCASRMLEADWPSHFLPLLLCARGIIQAVTSSSTIVSPLYLYQQVRCCCAPDETSPSLEARHSGPSSVSGDEAICSHPWQPRKSKGQQDKQPCL